MRVTHTRIRDTCGIRVKSDDNAPSSPGSPAPRRLASAPARASGLVLRLPLIQGWLFLQLLPLVSNKHMISLSLSSSADHFRGVLFKGGDDYACSAVATGRTLVYIEIPRSDTNVVCQDEVTMTSERHAQAGRTNNQNDIFILHHLSNLSIKPTHLHGYLGLV